MTRRGFVLAAVLFALVLLAALTATGFFSALQELRAGANAAALVRASSSASTAILDAIAGWNPAELDSLSIGTRTAVSVTPLAGTTVRLDARRLSASLFMLTATASAGGLDRTVSALARLRGLELGTLSAVRSRHVDVSILPRISGVNQAPAGWNCSSAGDTIASVTIQSGASDSTFLQFGDRDWAALLAWIARVPAGGDSLKARYWRGNLVMAGGHEAGLLVIEGDLVLDGGATIAGVVVVRGRLVLRGAGGVVSGAVVASQIIADASFTPSGLVVMYSSCAAEAAAISRAWPEWLPGARMVPEY